MDRDGTINQYKGLVYKEDDFVLEDCAVDAIRKINQSGRLGIVITNQPVVARGLCGIEDVENIHKKMETLLGKEGVFLDDVFFCPHHPDKGYPEENPAYKIPCECRKPKTGLIEKAAERFNIDLKESWMIGGYDDGHPDRRECGNADSACADRGSRKDKKYDVKPDLVCENLLDAVEKILKSEDR